MSLRGNYSKYSDNIKAYIIQSKNPYAYSSVPRSTARHWIKHRDLYKDTINKTPTKLLEDEVNKLNKNLKKKESLLNLITNVRKLYPYTFSKRKVKDKSLKKNIIVEISKAKKHNKVYICLEAIGLSLSTYKRWKAEVRPCIITKDLCAKNNTSTITLDELSKLRHYSTSPKYQHIPISRLHLLAQRNNDLFCSPNTWYKYNNIFEWRNFLPLKHKRKNLNGLKATYSNQFWHIDISYIKLMSGKKVYLQAIIDNFSRYIVNWQITANVSLENTFNLIKGSEQYSTGDTKLVSDQGSENKSISKFKYRLSSKMSFLLARIDIKQSNSMIEAFFKSLKNNYLYKQKLRNINDAKRYTNYYIHEHNKNPLQLLKSASPKEIYYNLWDQEKTIELSKNKRKALNYRKRQENTKKCRDCYL